MEEELEEEEEDSSESEDSKPAQRLFSDKEVGFSKGLFDTKTTSKKKTENKSKEAKSNLLFDFSKKENSSSLFGTTNSSSLFGDKPLFESSNKSSLFGDKPLFEFQSQSSLFQKEEKEEKDKKEEKEKEEEDEKEDDNIGKSNSPKYEYNPENFDKDLDDNNKYVKRYVKKVEKIFLLDKIEKKYICKGEGFISIETMTTKKEEKEKKDAIIVFRNNIGGLIFEGFLNEKINNINFYEKKGYFIVNFVFLMNDKNNNLYMTQCKIPFNNSEDSKAFVDIYNETIKYINLEINQFSNK